MESLHSIKGEGANPERKCMGYQCRCLQGSMGHVDGGGSREQIRVGWGDPYGHPMQCQPHISLWEHRRRGASFFKRGWKSRFLCEMSQFVTVDS